MPRSRILNPEYIRDNDYRKAEDALQLGDWERARSLLREVQTRYPGTEQIRHMLETAERGASYDYQVPTVRRRQWMSWSLTWLYTGLALFLLAAGVLFIWARAEQATAQQAQAVSDASKDLSDAEQALTAEHLPDSEHALAAWATTWPVGISIPTQVPTLRAALSTVEAEATQYAVAATTEVEGDLGSAVSLFASLGQAEPPYHDAAIRAANLQNRQSVIDLFQRAEQAYKAGDLAKARELYEQMSMQAHDYKIQIVTEHLVQIYNQQADIRLAGIGSDGEGLEEAADDYTKVLALRPDNNHAATARSQIRTYQRGVQLQIEGNINGAITQWRSLYNSDPGFLNGLLVMKLYTGYLEAGSQFEVRGDYPAAYRSYAEAAKLKGLDVSEARQRMIFLGTRATPTEAPVVVVATVTPRPSTTSTPTQSTP